MTGKRVPKTEFSRSVASGVTLVDFNAPWCRPCRKQAEIVKTLAMDAGVRARVKTMNVDHHRELALNLGIHSVPTIIIYQNGQEMRRFIGLQSIETLRRALKTVRERPNV